MASSLTPLPIFGATLTTTQTTSITISSDQASFTIYYPLPSPAPTSTTFSTSYTTLSPPPDTPTVTSLSILVLTEIVGIAVSSGVPIATRTLTQAFPSSQGRLIQVSGVGMNSTVGGVVGGGGGGCPKWMWSCQTRGQKIGTGFAIAIAAIAVGFFAWFLWFWCCGGSSRCRRKKSFVVVRRGGGRGGSGGGPPRREIEHGLGIGGIGGDGAGLLLRDLSPGGSSLKRSQRTRKRKKSAGIGRGEDDARGGLLLFGTEPQIGGGWSRVDAGPARTAERSRSRSRPRRKLSKRYPNNNAVGPSQPMQGEFSATNAQTPKLPPHPPSGPRKLSRSLSAKRPKPAPITAQGEFPTTTTTAQMPQPPPPQTGPAAPPEQPLQTPTSTAAVIGSLIGAAATFILDPKSSQQQPTEKPSQDRSTPSQQPARRSSRNQSAPSHPRSRRQSQNNSQRPIIAVRTTEKNAVRHAHFVDSPPATYSDQAIWRSDSNRESQRRFDEKRQRQTRGRAHDDPHTEEEEHEEDEDVEEEEGRSRKKRNYERTSSTDANEAPPGHRRRRYRDHSPPPPPPPRQVHPRAHSRWMALLPLALAALYELAGSKADLLQQQQIPRAPVLLQQQHQPPPPPPSRRPHHRRPRESKTQTHPLNQYEPPPKTANPAPERTQDKEERGRGTEPRSSDVRTENLPRERPFSFSPSPERAPTQKRRRVSRRDVRMRGENTEA